MNALQNASSNSLVHRPIQSLGIFSIILRPIFEVQNYQISSINSCIKYYLSFSEMKRRENEAFQKYGETFRAKVLSGYIMSTMDTKVIEKVLCHPVHYMNKADDYKILESVIGNGIVASRDYHWRSHRKVIQPAFGFGTLKKFMEIFDQKARIMVELLANKCDGTVLDMYEFVVPLTCDIIMETSMGMKINTQINSEQNEYVHAIGMYLFIYFLLNNWCVPIVLDRDEHFVSIKY